MRDLLCPCRPSKIVSTKLTARLQVGQKSLSTYESPALTLRWRAGPNHLRLAGARSVLITDSVRVLPTDVAAACRAAPAALFSPFTAVTVLHRDPPDVICKRVSVTMWGHARQCDPSLPLNGHDDPPHIRALLQNLLHNALAQIIILLHLVLAQLRPVVRPTLDRFPHHHAWQLPVFAFSHQCQSFFAWRHLGPMATSRATHCSDSPQPRLLSTSYSHRSSWPRLILCSKPCAPRPVANLPRALFSATISVHSLPFTIRSFLSPCLR